jgi:hypothetical protein
MDNIRSPFLLFVLSEKVFHELSYIGTATTAAARQLDEFHYHSTCDSERQYLKMNSSDSVSSVRKKFDLHTSYLQILSDLHTLNKGLTRMYKKVVSATADVSKGLQFHGRDPADLQFAMKLLDGICVLVSS